MARLFGADGIGLLVRRFAMGAVGTIALTLLAYVWRFAPRSGYLFSDNPAEWAHFGDYLAGTLGSAFAFLAFLGVLLTLRLQAIQLDLADKQAGLEEIQRLLATISLRLDQLLEQRVEHGFSLPSLRTSPASFFHVLSAGGTAVLNSSSDWLKQALGATTAEEAKRALAPPAIAVGLELDQLGWCLGQYRKGGGSPEVVAYYKRRYGAVACWLDALGLLSAHPFVRLELDPKSLRASLSGKESRAG